MDNGILTYQLHTLVLILNTQVKKGLKLGIIVGPLMQSAIPLFLLFLVWFLICGLPNFTKIYRAISTKILFFTC